MAERIILKARIAAVYFADVITSEEKLDLMSETDWIQQPITLRDDEISITEGEPEESEVNSHENDAPEDYDIAGTGLSVVGTFIKATWEQMAELMGGTATVNAYKHSSKKLILEKAIRFKLKNGGEFIVPCAKGSVQFNGNAGYDGLLSHPFRFRALAQTGFDTDLIVR